MRKVFRQFLLLGLLAAFGREAEAQIGAGGLPLSLQTGGTGDYVPVTTAALPDWKDGLKQWEAKAEPKPYLVALMTAVDFGFPGSGIFYSTADGTKVWRAKIQVAGAKGLGFYYDRFHLPKGVKLFLSNANGKQVLGAFTADNNNEYHNFVNEAVQGEVVNLELNIAPGVDPGGIQLHIDRAASYFRSLEHLTYFIDDNLSTIDVYDDALTGRSSVCMINAICPQANGYEVQRDAAFQWLIDYGSQGVGSCSATMVNNTGNSTSNCKQYLVLASHCEGSNATGGSTFSQVILRYNFQHAACATQYPTIPATTRSINGATFVARSVLPVTGGQTDPNALKGDFLLMLPSSTIPSTWGVNLAGWNNSANIPTSQSSPRKFIGFHHPGGDAKKVSYSQEIQSYSIGAANTHWVTQFTEGLGAQGSSGSGFFDGDGRLIGIASVAAVGQGVSSACQLDPRGNNVLASTSNIVLYSKFSYDWDYSADGNATNRKLKPWLDPANTGAVTLDAVKSDCSPLGSTNPTGITHSNKLDEGLSVYPNPTSTGHTTLRINLAEASDLHLDLYDISGKKVRSYQLPRVSSGTYNLDMSSLANGAYLLKATDGYNHASRKILLAR